ncbi:MAG TPA: hypothetical protein VG603_06520 [Chitinophagales bacterium]|nr:hypothetical protein [Chitinophagales bacterium]
MQIQKPFSDEGLLFSGRFNCFVFVNFEVQKELMTYLLEIKETAESRPLIEHLKTLKYVKVTKSGKKKLQKPAITPEEIGLPIK